MPRPPRPSSIESMPSPDVLDMDYGCCITNVLQKHALALHQMTLTQGVVDPSDPKSLEPLMSTDKVSGTHHSSSLRNSSGSTGVSYPTFIEIL